MSDMNDKPTKDGGPAFPIPLNPHEEWNPAAEGPDGMSLRDYFAGQALKWATNDEWFSNKPDHAASRAYQMADAMLKAREGA